MNSKVKTIFIIYFSLLIVSACCNTETFEVQIIEIEVIPTSTFVPESEDFEFNLKKKDSIVGMAWNISDFNLIPSAYAYDCDNEDTYRPIETVNEMKVRVLTDFSDEYQTDDFITDLVTVRFYNWRSQNIEIKTLEEFFDFLRQDNRATSRSAELHNATYIITERPLIDNEQQFQLEFIFTDNSTLTTLTETIIWE